jgi:hypothetical protein
MSFLLQRYNQTDTTPENRQKTLQKIGLIHRTTKGHIREDT